MNVQDDLYLGSGFTLGVTTSANPTLNQGCGPLGRVFVYNIQPLTKATANIAALQHPTNGTPLVLTAATGVTKTTAPDGTTVYQFDVPRVPSATTSANMSTIAVTFKGYDTYWQPMTQTLTLGGSATTVNALKAMYAITSVTPNGTDGTNNVSIGSSDIFGLPFACADVGFILSVKWAETLADDAGTFVAAVQTIPSTAALGDVRGTYLPSSASDGTKRLVIAQHLLGSQCSSTATKFTFVNGASATVTGAIGVQQV